MFEKQMVPCKSTAEEVSFKKSHHRISSTDSKVRTTLHVSVTDSEGETRVKLDRPKIGKIPTLPICPRPFQMIRNVYDFVFS